MPPGVKVEFPLQAYFRINAANMGQFERTLIIVDEGGYVHYVEGCTAPMYSTESLHSAVVEVIAKRGARVRYTTIQNWANNIYNLVTKRAMAYGDSLVEWVDGNLGSRLTMKYPVVYMMEPRRPRRGPLGGLRLGRPAPGRRRQGGPLRPAHLQPHHLEVDLQERRPGQLPRPGAVHARGQAVEVERRLRRPDPRCPQPQRHLSYIEIEEQDVMVGHEASVSRIGEEQLFYLRAAALTEAEATQR